MRVTWRGFIKASERQRIDLVMDRARRLGYYPSDAPTFADLCDNADDELFSKARLWSNHVMHALLPESSAARHNDTTSDNELTHCNCLSLRLSCLIVIS